MANAEVIRFAGDVSIDNVEVISNNGFGADIANQVVAMEIYEDLFSPFISGVLAVKESLDLINLFPFVGEEYLNLRVHTPSMIGKDKTIDDQFYIYKVNNRTKIGDRNVVYEMHFISREAMVDVNKKVSRAYEGKISEIAKKIITDPQNGLESKKPTVIEETPNGVKFISNFWSPLKSLNYIAETAVNPNNSAGYIFFENRNGFNFVSFEKMYNSQPIQNFIYDGYTRDFKPDGTANRNVEKEYQRINEVNIPDVFDYLDRSKMGLFASKQIAHDITTKKYMAKNFDMLDEFPKQKHLNPYPLVSGKNIRRSGALVINYTKYYNNFNNYADVTNSRTVQKRTSLLEQAQGSKIQIVVPGRTDYTVGSKVNVKLNKFIPIQTSDTDDDVLDKMFSGNYIISSINHAIDRDSHLCYMELIKDTFIIDLDKGK
jgi:hypothetical protein